VFSIVVAHSVVLSPADGRAHAPKRLLASKKPAMEPSARRVTDRRRDAALAGHRGDRTAAVEALGDPSPSVRATALGALRRMGTLTPGDLDVALQDASPIVRRRAVELSAGVDGVDITGRLGDDDPSVVEMAAWAAGERGQKDAIGPLMALAVGRARHPDPLCREAAVAALGAIGDPRGLDAVVEALEDKPAVRRRAAVALVAFDGPEAESALRRCLDDRDWQVRQVAEDLLAPD
jgi:HEAT repeat protein